MPPKAAKKRAGSTAGETAAAAAAAIAELRINTSPTPARSRSTSLSNKSGTPTQLLAKSPTGYKAGYTPTAAYMSGDNEAIDARQTPGWVNVWMTIATVIVIWDCSYILSRPWSLESDIAKYIWAPYHNIYGNVDKWYGREGWENYLKGEEGWNMTQSMWNAVEVAMQILFLYMSRVRDPAAPVVALITSVSTFVKTMLYFMIMLNGTPAKIVPSITCLTESNYDVCGTFIGTYVIPNGFWIVVPLLIIWSTASQLSRANAIAPPKKFV